MVMLDCYNIISYGGVLIFLDNTFWKSLHMRFERETSPNHVCDVYDGMGYKKHDDFVRQPGNVSLVVNTDGVKMFNSSSISMWPIWLVVNELPPSERYVVLKIVVLLILPITINPQI